jgi:hypothetical protein
MLPKLVLHGNDVATASRLGLPATSLHSVHKFIKHAEAKQVSNSHVITMIYTSTEFLMSLVPVPFFAVARSLRLVVVADALLGMVNIDVLLLPFAAPPCPDARLSTSTSRLSLH